MVRAQIGRALALAAGVLAGGAGLGFVARDLLGLGQPVVALAWLAGALVVAASAVGPGVTRAVRGWRLDRD
jgi:hypothetical protein